MSNITTRLSACAAVLVFGLSACGGDDGKAATESLKASLDSAVDSINEAADTAAEKTADAVDAAQEAGAETMSAAKDIGNEVMEERAAMMEEGAAMMEEGAAIMEESVAMVEEGAAIMEESVAMMEEGAAETSGAAKDGPKDSVDKLLAKMEFGAIAFNVPNNVNIEASPQIQLVLSLADTVEKLKQSITEEGEKIGATIRVSDQMEARLSGYMFQITAITPEIQAVSKSQQTEWKWEIHPKEEGKHRLHLTLTALLEIDGRSTFRAIRTFDKTIEVSVTASQKVVLFFKNNWQWLWAAILVPVVGWLWRINRKKGLE